MFNVFSSFDIIVLALLSFALIGYGTRFGLILLWLIYFALGNWFKDWTFAQVLTWTMKHTLDLVIYVSSYLAIGVVWSIFKWYLFVLNSANEYRALIAKYNALPEPRPSWEEYSRYSDIPDANIASNKTLITDWIAFWWFSVINTILGDWMHQLVVAAYNLVSNVYNAITKHIYSKIDVPK
jgi:hypothetical protein